MADALDGASHAVMPSHALDEQGLADVTENNNATSNQFLDAALDDGAGAMVVSDIADMATTDDATKTTNTNTTNDATTTTTTTTTAIDAVAPSVAPDQLPASFPRKRRGRPPGRPNQTVKEEDYQDNALVQAWNAARSTAPLTVYSMRIREALRESALVHDTQRAVFRLPSKEVIYFVHGWITARHVASQRPSYVNGLLIHSRGDDAPVECTACQDRRAKNALGPFLTCRTLPGSYHNSCSNCKWFDNTSSCSLYTGPKPNRKRKPKEPADGPDAEPTAGRKKKSKRSTDVEPVAAESRPAVEPDMGAPEPPVIPDEPASLLPHGVLNAPDMLADHHMTGHPLDTRHLGQNPLATDPMAQPDLETDHMGHAAASDYPLHHLYVT